MITVHSVQYEEGGIKLREAAKAMILLHGRGASAYDILHLESYLPVSQFYLAAPQATNHTWYPYSFMEPVTQNEPWLSSALEVVKELTDMVMNSGIPAHRIYFLGFSQGACLTLEFAARNARKWGGLIAFTGGLIGEQVDTSRYSGDFEGTPVFIGTGDPDAHVPLSRVQESQAVLESMGAKVQLAVYPHRPHTISADELLKAGELLSI